MSIRFRYNRVVVDGLPQYEEIEERFESDVDNPNTVVVASRTSRIINRDELLILLAGMKLKLQANVTAVQTRIDALTNLGGKA